MPFLTDFSTDLFISYSAIDNEPLLPGHKGWISSFQHSLSLRLAQLLGSRPTIVGDHELLPENGGPNSAGILISVVSPAYISSQECLKEIDHFIESARHTGGLSLDDKSRIFKVTKTPVDREKQPSRILNLLNYDFYQVEASGRAHELKPEGNPNLVENYWLKLDDIAFDIQQVLEKLKTRGNGKVDHPVPVESPTAKAKSVFISYASKDEVVARRICTLLEAQGISCWIAVRDAIPGWEYAADIADALDAAQAVVLVLSAHSNDSVHVPHEVEWATSHRKPVFTVRIEDVQPSRRLALHISTRHWLNAWNSALEERISLLGSTIKQEIGLKTFKETIYLAETSFNLRDEYDSIRRELQQRGYSVLPDRLLPSDAASFKQAVHECLQRSCLSVHLIGDSYGECPKGETRSLIHLQNDLALERSKDSGFSHLIWMPPGIEGQDGKQRDFIDGLRRDRSEHRRFELLQNSLEELKSYIEETLTNRTPPSPPPPVNFDGPLHIYLICDQQDLPAVWPIRDYLYNEGYEAVLPIMTGNEADMREDHKENLLECDACLMYYGAGNEFWLRSKLRDLQKSVGYGRTKPMRARTVYLSDPDTPHKTNYRTLDAMVIRGFGTFNTESLRPFLAALSQTQNMGGGRQ